MLVDAERNRVLVCNEDVGVSLSSTPGTRNRVAQVLEFNLDTGELQQTYDLIVAVGRRWPTIWRSTRRAIST